jgi:hypothetical protein
VPLLEWSGFRFYGPGGLVAFLVIFGVYAAVVVYPGWRILRKLGYGAAARVPWIIAFVFIPYISLWFFAFAKWPLLRDLCVSEPLD